MATLVEIGITQKKKYKIKRLQILLSTYKKMQNVISQYRAMAVLGPLFLCLLMTVAEVVSQSLDDRHALEEDNTITQSHKPYKFEVIAFTKKYSKTFLKGQRKGSASPRQTSAHLRQDLHRQHPRGLRGKTDGEQIDDENK